MLLLSFNSAQNILSDKIKFYKDLKHFIVYQRFQV